MCLHENGSLSVRVRRKTNTISTPAPEGHGAFGEESNKSKRQTDEQKNKNSSNNSVNSFLSNVSEMLCVWEVCELSLGLLSTQQLICFLAVVGLSNVNIMCVCMYIYIYQYPLTPPTSPPPHTHTATHKMLLVQILPQGSELWEQSNPFSVHSAKQIIFSTDN